MTPQEALPTEPGWYFDSDGDPWRLYDDGEWELHEPESNNRSANDRCRPDRWGPFVRVIPETELAHTDSIKILLQRAIDALKRQDRGELEFLIKVCDTPEMLGGDI